MLLGVQGALPWRFHWFGHRTEVNFNIPGHAVEFQLHPILVHLLHAHAYYIYNHLHIYIYTHTSGCFCCLMLPKSIAVARIVGIMKKLRRWLLESEDEAEMSSSQVGHKVVHTCTHTHIEFMVATRALLHTPISLAFFSAKPCISCRSHVNACRHTIDIGSRCTKTGILL